MGIFELALSGCLRLDIEAAFNSVPCFELSFLQYRMTLLMNKKRWVFMMEAGISWDRNRKIGESAESPSTWRSSVCQH